MLVGGGSSFQTFKSISLKMKCQGTVIKLFYQETCLVKSIKNCLYNNIILYIVMTENHKVDDRVTRRLQLLYVAHVPIQLCTIYYLYILVWLCRYCVHNNKTYCYYLMCTKTVPKGLLFAGQSIIIYVRTKKGFYPPAVGTELRLNQNEMCFTPWCSPARCDWVLLNIVLYCYIM